MSSIRVTQGKRICELPFQPGETLLSILRSGGFSVPAACGGKGRCGKCRVSLNGTARLACRVFPREGDEVVLPEQSGGVVLAESPKIKGFTGGGTGCAAAVDLGTTTVVLRLYDLATGRELGTAGRWNVQAPYGADVISRIQYTLEQDGGLEELSKRSREQVWSMAEELLRRENRPVSDLKSITVVGNTVMEHLFAGRSVKEIAAAPFRPNTLFEDREGPALHGVPVWMAPCVAGYVGGDITAGLLASGLWEWDGTYLFLDIGTNGEMALGGKEGFLSCAVASGPAFEGAGITCGMPGIDGAVSHVRYSHGFLYDVIGGGQAKGLCGSGLLDLAAELLRLGILDESGRLLPPESLPEELRRYVQRDDNGNGLFRLTDQVYLTAEDVRNLQLAKAAVAAGIRVLLKKQNLRPEQINGLYLAGGFGSYMDPNSAMAIGMLPRQLEGKLYALGNAALAGASMLATDPEAWGQMNQVAGKCTYIELSGSSEFTAAFAEEMIF